MGEPLRPREPADQRRARRAARRARARDPRRLHAPAGGRALRAPRGARAARPRPRVLRLRRRLGDRDRAQDGVPLLEQPRPAGEDRVRVASRAATTARRSARSRSPTCRSSATSTRRCSSATRPCPRPTRAPRAPGESRATSPSAPRRRSTRISRAHHATTAALIVEPLVQGASGMAMYDPHYLAPRPRALHAPRRAADRRRDHDRASAAPARCSPASRPGIAPDFLCLSKGITGGYLPLSCVLTTRRRLRRVLRRRHGARLPALALVHRQRARLPRGARGARHLPRRRRDRREPRARRALDGARRAARRASRRCAISATAE